MQFAAVCMPFVMTLPEGVVVYVAGDVAEADGVEYVPVAEYGADVVAAGVPVVLAAENGTYAIGVGGEPVKFYDLKGNLVEKPVRGIYVTSQGVKVLVK